MGRWPLAQPQIRGGSGELWSPWPFLFQGLFALNDYHKLPVTLDPNWALAPAFATWLPWGLYQTRTVWVESCSKAKQMGWWVCAMRAPTRSPRCIGKQELGGERANAHSLSVGLLWAVLSLSWLPQSLSFLPSSSTQDTESGNHLETWSYIWLIHPIYRYSFQERSVSISVVFVSGTKYVKTMIICFSCHPASHHSSPLGSQDHKTQCDIMASLPQGLFLHI